MAPIPNPDPLGLPIPAPWLLILKGFGFFLHLIFMTLWVGGVPVALALLRKRPLVAKRLFRMMPFFLAFGINAGIVPLLFLQTLYPQFFYPATILQAWFWFLIIPLLLIAYFSVYLASFDRFPLFTGGIAFLLLTWIGLTFSAAMSLTAAPEEWWRIFITTARAGAVHGWYLHLRPETFLRFGLVFGMALGSVAALLALDTEWFAKDPGYPTQTRTLAPVLSTLGLALYGIAGVNYLPMVVGKIPLLAGTLTGMGMPVVVALAVIYWRWPGRGSATVLTAAQLLVLLLNAVTRQIAQIERLKQWGDLQRVPVRGEWGSFLFFIITLTIGVFILTWIGLTVLRKTKQPN